MFEGRNRKNTKFLTFWAVVRCRTPPESPPNRELPFELFGMWIFSFFSIGNILGRSKLFCSDNIRIIQLDRKLFPFPEWFFVVFCSLLRRFSYISFVPGVIFVKLKIWKSQNGRFDQRDAQTRGSVSRNHLCPIGILRVQLKQRMPRWSRECSEASEMITDFSDIV